MKPVFIILFSTCLNLYSQKDCSKIVKKYNGPSPGKEIIETKKEFIAGNVHSKLYLYLTKTDSNIYFIGEILQNRTGGAFYNIFEGQSFQIQFKDSTSVSISVRKIISNTNAQNTMDRSQLTHFVLSIQDSVLVQLKTKEIKEVIIDNHLGIDRKENELLTTYRKFHSNELITKWYDCLINY